MLALYVQPTPSLGHRDTVFVSRVPSLYVYGVVDCVRTYNSVIGLSLAVREIKDRQPDVFGFQK